MPPKILAGPSLLAPMAQNPFPLPMGVVPAPMGFHPLLGAKRANGLHVLHSIYRLYGPDWSYPLNFLHMSPVFFKKRSIPTLGPTNQKPSARQLGCQLLHNPHLSYKDLRLLKEIPATVGAGTMLANSPDPHAPRALKNSPPKTGNSRTSPAPGEPSPAPGSPWPPSPDSRGTF